MLSLIKTTYRTIIADSTAGKAAVHIETESRRRNSRIVVTRRCVTEALTLLTRRTLSPRLLVVQRTAAVTV